MIHEWQETFQKNKKGMKIITEMLPDIVEVHDSDHKLDYRYLGEGFELKTEDWSAWKGTEKHTSRLFIEKCGVSKKDPNCRNPEGPWIYVKPGGPWKAVVDSAVRIGHLLIRGPEPVLFMYQTSEFLRIAEERIIKHKLRYKNPLENKEHVTWGYAMERAWFEPCLIEKIVGRYKGF